MREFHQVKIKTNLESQLEKLRLFASAKGYQIVKEIKDIGSGLNDNRSKLNELFEKELIILRFY